jgi:glycosyltransferase involved in cell wall biosynthesis
VAELDAVRQRHRLTQRSIALAVASNLPHKNLPTLIEALALIEPAIRPLVVIAGDGTDDGELQRRADAAGIGESVRLLGVRSREELEVLYALAACVVMPTLHEGFGLPAIEAMARSVPVACSDIPALREVAGEAALYFDPRDREDIAAKVSELVTTPNLSEHLRHLGRARASQFSWRSAAEGTLASYRRALAA